jgi:hypothetical protein
MLLPCPPSPLAAGAGAAAWPNTQTNTHKTRAELYSEHFMDFFGRVEVANFEIASDAFSSFKVWEASQGGGGCVAAVVAAAGAVV